jgi:transcriptional regulator with XRE-family HTH domain
MTAKQNTADIESLIGERIRSRRIQVGMSRQELGKALGVTFQQIQKYEKGSNRVSYGGLLKIAEALECNVMQFFEGLTMVQKVTSTAFSKFMSTKEGVAIVEAMLKIKSQEMRRTVIDIAEKLAET